MYEYKVVTVPADPTPAQAEAALNAAALDGWELDQFFGNLAIFRRFLGR